MKAEELHDDVKKLIDRDGVVHKIRPWLGSHDGTRLAGFVLQVDRDPNPKPKKRRPATYKLINLDPVGC